MSDNEFENQDVKHPERRKKSRRSTKDRREAMRWGLENPIRRKSPGRRALDRLYSFLGPKK